MDNYLKELYELTYTPLVTPYNILENIKLDNYKYIKYSKWEEGIVAEINCLVDDEVDTIFMYYFDDKNYLQKIYMKQDDEGSFVFNRKTRIEEVRTECLNDLSEVNI